MTTIFFKKMVACRPAVATVNPAPLRIVCARIAVLGRTTSGGAAMAVPLNSLWCGRGCASFPASAGCHCTVRRRTSRRVPWWRRC